MAIVTVSVIATPFSNTGNAGADKNAVEACNRYGNLETDMDYRRPVRISKQILKNSLIACEAAHEKHPNNPKYMFLYGLSLIRSKNIAKGSELLIRSANKNYSYAEQILADYIESGKIKGEGLPSPLALLERSAAHGNPFAMLRLAQIYARGSRTKGISRDLDRAMRLVDDAAENGAPGKDFHKASIILSAGVGGDKKKEAISIMEKEVLNGNVMANYTLGMHYWLDEPQIRVKGVGYMSKRSYDLFKHAAEKGDPYSKAMISPRGPKARKPK